MKYLRIFFKPPVLLSLMVMAVYWQFFLLGNVPLPADTLVGAYFPWYDYNWGYPVHVPVKNALISDVFSQFFLWKYLAVDLIKSGQIPLWNIYSFTGTPLLATYHSAVLNPFNLLLFLPKYYGWGFYIFGQSLIAALGMYLLLGKFVKNPGAKIAGSLVFTFSGLMTTWIEFGTGVWAASMLPWIFFALVSFLESSKFRFLFLMSLAFLLLFLSGHAQLTLYSSILVSIYAVFFGKLKKIFLIWIFLVLAVFMTMAQFLPSYEFTGESIRKVDSYAQVTKFLSPYYEIVRLVAADFFGNPTTNNHWDNQSYHEQSSFLGTISLCFIIPLFLKRFRSKIINFWSITFLISIFLAIDSPISRWFYSQPLPFLTYSSASRTLFITSFAGAVLMGIGVDRYFTDKNFFLLVRRTTLFLSAGLAGMALGFFIGIRIIDEINLAGIDKLIINFNVSVRNLAIPILLSGLLAVLSNRFISKKLLYGLIILILLFDLGRYFLKYNPFVPQRIVFPDTPITQFLKEQKGLFRVLRMESDLMPPNTWIGYRLQSIEGYDPLYGEDYARFFSVLNGGDYNSSSSRYREVIRIDSPLFDSLNVKYALKVKRNLESTPSGDYINRDVLEKNYKIVFEDKRTVIFENPKVFERAYFVESLINVNSLGDLANKLSDKAFDPSKSAIILNESLPSENLAKGTVEIEKYTANEIELKTDSKSEGFLVFADNYNRGWKLLKNGTEDKLYKVNGTFRGISVPAGVNYFKMYYWPDSFDLGLKISAGTLVLFAFVLLYTIKKRIF